MYTAKLSIKQSAIINHGDWQESATDVLYLLIGYLINNGQIADGEYPIFRQDDGICAVVMAFNHDSLDARFYNSYIHNTLNQLNNNDFTVQMLGESVDGWQLDTSLHGRYDFRCDNCHLLSNIGMGEQD